jgi:hypothetical protein
MLFKLSIKVFKASIAIRNRNINKLLFVNLLLPK